MAKFEKTLFGEVATFIDHLDRAILTDSTSASLENGAATEVGEAIVLVRVYERFTVIGRGRVSLLVTVVSWGPQLYVCAITSGGSSGITKIGVLGERTFLNKAIRAIETYGGDASELR